MLIRDQTTGVCFSSAGDHNSGDCALCDCVEEEPGVTVTGNTLHFPAHSNKHVSMSNREENMWAHENEEEK